MNCPVCGMNMDYICAGIWRCERCGEIVLSFGGEYVFVEGAV